MSAHTDIADALVLRITEMYVTATDPDKRARLLRLARAAVKAWRRIYAREARLSRMHSAYRARRR